MKCKHNWEAVNLVREKDYDLHKGFLKYKNWIVTFVCPKCKKLKSEICKDLK